MCCERPHSAVCQGRAVLTARSLDEGLQVVVPLGAHEAAFDENNGKLVHVSGPLTTDNVRLQEMMCFS